MYLNDLEAERLAHCPTLYHWRVYFAALRLQREDPMPPWKFYKTARVAPVRGRLVLAELCTRRRWLDKHAFGPPGSLRTVRYVSTARGGQEIPRDLRQEIPRDLRQEIPRDLRQEIPRDLRQEIPRDLLGRGGKRSQEISSSLNDLDLPSGELVHKTKPSVRTGESRERGDKGRTDGSQKFVGLRRKLVGSIVDAWREDQPVAEICARKFFDELSGIEPEPTEHELTRYLGAALDTRERRYMHPAFSGIKFEKFLGCTLSLFRFERWREHEAALAAERNQARERERAAELAQRRDVALRVAPSTTELFALMENARRKLGH